jgi:hypothetical protein
MSEFGSMVGRARLFACALVVVLAAAGSALAAKPKPCRAHVCKQVRVHSARSRTSPREGR